MGDVLVPGMIVQVSGASGSGLSRLAERCVTAGVGTTALVGQDAAAHVTGLRASVREEVAFGLEQRGVAVEVMRSRVAEALDAVGLHEQADHDPTRLSGGQTTRLAIAAAVALHPDVLVLDDAFASLDEASAGLVAVLCRRLAQHGAAVVSLGYRPVAGLSGRRVRLGEPYVRTRPPERVTPAGGEVAFSQVSGCRGARGRRWWRRAVPPSFRVGPVDLAVPRGGVLWLTGPNGSGKTTLLRALAGLDAAGAAEPARGALALQTASDQVIDATVGAFAGARPELPAWGIDRAEHPLDLSRSRLRLTQLLAVVGRGLPVLLLDEPDDGLDDWGRDRFHELLAGVLRDGRAVVLTCHDPGFVAEVAAYAEVHRHELGG